MSDSTLQDLNQFILRAKASTYVGGGQKLLPYRLGSHDLQFFDGTGLIMTLILGGMTSSVRKQFIIISASFGR